MKRIRFTHRYQFRFDGIEIKENERFTPDFVFPAKYHEVDGVVNMVCQLIPNNKYKTLPNGKTSGIGICYVDIDLDAIALFGWDLNRVIQELQRFGDWTVTIETKDTLKAFITKYTDCEEVEPYKFLVQEEYTELDVNLQEITVPAKYLDLNINE